MYLRIITHLPVSTQPIAMRLMGVIIAVMVILSHTHAMAITTPAPNAIVMDARTRTILLQKEATAPLYPASMTKMMTAYMVFDALASGNLTMDTTMRVSEKAWRKGGSKMFVTLDDMIALRDLIRGIIIQSGNDACIVVAEHMAGSEEAFAQLMTAKAKTLGMTSTHFTNATGWPDEAHVTSAHDLVMLVDRTIRDFPQYYPIYAERAFTYHDIPQYNRNMLLGRNIGVDGLKTGHTEAAGYGIAISGEQDAGNGDRRRVHVVVGGLDSEKARAEAAQALYTYGQKQFRYVSGVPVGELPVYYGVKDKVSVRFDETLIIPKLLENARFTATLDTSLTAPIVKGQQLGVLAFTHDDMSSQSVALYAAEDVAEAGYISRFITNLTLLRQHTSP